MFFKVFLMCATVIVFSTAQVEAGSFDFNAKKTASKAVDKAKTKAKAGIYNGAKKQISGVKDQLKNPLSGAFSLSDFKSLEAIRSSGAKPTNVLEIKANAEATRAIPQGTVAKRSAGLAKKLGGVKGGDLLGGLKDKATDKVLKSTGLDKVKDKVDKTKDKVNKVTSKAGKVKNFDF